MSAGGTIRVRLNGDVKELPAGLSVETLLRSLDLHPKLVVVERNGDILRRDSYAGTRVEEGDTLELVHFVGGG
jgi:thiamine biosynthesis protein ThiS